jgi:hypothetical protein
MSSNVWDAIGNVSNAVGSIWGNKESGSYKTHDVAYQAEIGKNMSYPTKQNSNTLMYIGMGGIGLVLMMFMMSRK